MTPEERVELILHNLRAAVEPKALEESVIRVMFVEIVQGDE